MMHLRALAAKYSRYEISTYNPLWPFVDQYEQVLPNTIQEIYSGISFMVLIAIFFIPSLVCSVWVALAILSIDVGVLGYMAFWGINLDVISMITIVMSIGFSVDFTAHIAHAFVVSEVGRLIMNRRSRVSRDIYRQQTTWTKQSMLWEPWRGLSLRAPFPPLSECWF